MDESLQIALTISVVGMTIGIEFDIASDDIVRAAAGKGLRVEAAGEVGIRIQPPLVIGSEDQDLLLRRLAETMEVIEREAAPMTI